MNMRDTIPPTILESLDRYVNDRVPTGGFLAAVLANDLYMAAAKADDANRLLLANIADYVHHCLPMACRGSADAVRKWTRPQGEH